MPQIVLSSRGRRGRKRTGGVRKRRGKKRGKQTLTHRLRRSRLPIWMI
ncbi:MAG: hypothetical protein ACKESB_02685 [Candidatus Hodgkinia cicadicola]